jgi:glycosyltransferase involved in cell wall biosynthesis
MRIAVVSDAMHPTPWELGHGLGRAVFNLARRLAMMRHQVTLFGLAGSALPGGEVVTTDVQGLGGERYLADEVERRLAAFDVALDCGHLHETACRTMLPTVALFEDRGSRPAQNAVFVSRDLQAHLGLPGTVITNGIEPDEYPLYEGRREEWAVFLGHSLEHKRWPDAVRAAALAGREIRGYGDGLSMGPVAGDAKLALLQHAACLVHPADREAGPLTVLEAMSCGTPVVARRAGGTPEYVQDGVGGWLCDTVEEMAEAMRQSGRLQPADVRASVVEGRFTAERQAAQIEWRLRRAVLVDRW